MFKKKSKPLYSFIYSVRLFYLAFRVLFTYEFCRGRLSVVCVQASPMLREAKEIEEFSTKGKKRVTV